MKKWLSLFLVVMIMSVAVASCAPPATPAPTAIPPTEVKPTEATAGQPAATTAVEPTAVPQPTATKAAEPTAVPQPTATKAAEPTAAKPKVFTWQYHAEPITLDTSKVNDNMSGDMLYNLSEGLVRYYDSQIMPGIAATWDISKDGLTYTFHLRDAQWEDGKAVTAQQFEYSFLRFLDPKTATTFPDALYPVLNAEDFNKSKADASKVGVKATDDKTLVLTLHRPMSYFLQVLATSAYFYPLRQEFVEKYGDKYASDETTFLSNGPFKLKKWAHEASLDLVKNPNYWNADKIKLDEMVQVIAADPNTIVSMFDSGELDYIPNLSTDFVSKYPNAQVSTGGSLQFLEFNVTGMTPEVGKVLSNVNFRKALSYALDRKALNAAVAGSTGTITGRLVQTSVPGMAQPFVEEYPLGSDQLVPPQGDPDKAKAYLAAALKELGTTVDKLPTLTYVAMESPVHKLYAEGFVDAWSQVLGLKNIKITILPIPQAIQAGMQHKFDIFLLGMGADPDPFPFLNYWTAVSDTNWSGWADKTYADNLQKADAITDPKARLAALAESEKYLVANGPLESLWEPGNFYLVQDYASGVVRSGLGANSQLIYVDINK
jgi:oligopeptide transport system substrate-binding protein